MIEKLFILGLPGSGKSTLARFILKYISLQQVDKQNDQFLSAIRFNDYAALLDMFQKDLAGKRFKSADPSGFDVLDLEVFDEALQILERKVNAYIDSLISEGKKLILIEFSRNNYYHAFQQFNASFLKDAYILYLDTDLLECKQRICNRSNNPKNPNDDYPVSEYIFEEYYHADDWISITGILAKDFGVEAKRVWTFCNNNSFEMTYMEIEPFIEHILNYASQEDANDLRDPLEELVPTKVGESPRTSPFQSEPNKQAECKILEDSPEKQLADVVS